MTIYDCTTEPIEIEPVPDNLHAMRFDGTPLSARAIEAWVRGGGGECSIRWVLDEAGDVVEPLFLRLHTPHGLLNVDTGDFVCRDADGNFLRLHEPFVASRYRLRQVGAIGGAHISQ